ncbi:MAG: bifunctional demethylmenaquinone methyltransferase/2-methoxy-6-polyprenyl-1,4-benzoquinol methylase UbiE [Polyangiaceae bacterium]|nr:bifunctional demethylmenaquinone methyltransferase/2-methoxy-6-polyprenyl-1,4-benzoquinol methylase UbiE [Polyangiaceae bacterium]
MNVETMARLAQDGSGEMFDAIASRYDLLNRLMSLGNDRRWRLRTVQALALRGRVRVLDLATGTADLALLVARSLRQASVIAVDPSREMRRIARRKISAAGLDDRIELLDGRAEELPFEDTSFDAVCMAFGIRNVPDRPRALSEILRVLRPGGTAALLELTEPNGGWLLPFVWLHVHAVVPLLGAALSGSREYRYLQRSIAAFPRPSEFARMMTAAGFAATTAESLTAGACHLFVGRRGPAT